MNIARRRAIGVGLAIAVFAVDQWVKWHMLHTLRLREVHLIDILPFFDLRWTENYGISLGMLTAETTEMRWILVGLTAAIALGVLIWMLRERLMSDIAGLALVLGGALGNIRDRIGRGYVIDYADLHFGEFRPFMIFNIADAAITIGVLIILARSLLSREKPDNAAPKAGNDPAPEI